MSEGENYKESNRVEREIHFTGREGNTHKNCCPNGTNVYNEHFQNTEVDIGTVLVGSVIG